jgi:bile acid-coenzyme A ligase
MSIASQFTAAAASAATHVPLGRILAHHARREPNRPMLTYGERTIGFGEFDVETNRLARILITAGVRQGDFVALILPNGVPIFQLAFALWKIGAAPAPLSPNMPASELRAILDTLAPRMMIDTTLACLRGVAFAHDGLILDDAHGADPLPDAPLKYWKASASGGSTGRPKVIVSHLLRSWDPSSAVFGAEPGSRAINVGPLYHNAPFNLAVCHMFSGSHVVEAGRFEPEPTLALIDEFQIQWINLVPTMMHRIWQLGAETRGRYHLSSLRYVWHMASMCPKWLKEAWIEWLGPDRIFESYGGSEGNGGTTIDGNEWLTHKGSVGRCNPGYKMAVLDESGQPCRPGEPGEIFMAPAAGDDPGFHYIGAEPNSCSGLISLGDIGYVDAEGYLYLLDRRKDMIITGGANVYPAEVEGALDEHPDVASSLVVGLPDPEWGHRVHALVQRAPKKDGLSAEALRAHLRERLTPYKIPKSFEFVDQPLRDDAGKARRSMFAETRAAAAMLDRPSS